jgi:hypothetical protein
MEDLRKKHKEILALYKLEKDIKDVYVEGNSDRVFINNYLRNKNCLKTVVTIDIIDFSELNVEDHPELKLHSNKGKLLILSKLLDEQLPSTNVRCVVDKDFDDYIKSISNNKLLRTDFSCIESYIFCEEVLDKFLEIGIRSFPVNAKHVISELSNVLKSLFCLRLLREMNFRDAELVIIDSNLNINKSDAKINFDEYDYLNKFIIKNGLAKEKENVIEKYNKLKQELNMEIRHYIHGHDFLTVLFLYVNKIKNTPKFKEDNFERTLFLTVETAMIENYKLFKDLVF